MIFRILLTSFTLSFAGTAATYAQTVEPGTWYRINNLYLQNSKFLSIDTTDPERYSLVMADTANSDAQYWKFEALGDGYYRVTNSALGYCKSLSVSANNHITPVIEDTDYGYNMGQEWKMKLTEDGEHFRFLNSRLTDHKALDIYSDGNNEPFVGNTVDNSSGQYWKLTPFRNLLRPGEIPELDPKRCVDLTEGPTNYRIYQKAVGDDGNVKTLDALMLFVDFPDRKKNNHGKDPSFSVPELKDKLLGQGRVQQLFRSQSYGKMKLRVSTPVMDWRMMPKPASAYGASNGFESFEAQGRYLADAFHSFKTIDFDSFDIVIVVASDTEEIGNDEAYTEVPGQGVKTSNRGGEIRLAITTGIYSYDPKYRHESLVHEIGHLLGLPDTYNITNGILTAGPWGLMSDTYRSTSFLGWHRHKLGWLESDRKTYHSSGKLSATLVPFSSASGMSMIVVPAGNPWNPSVVYVIELAQPVLDSNMYEVSNGGVLIYKVDATIPTGMDPIIIQPNDPTKETESGRLYRAAFEEIGDYFDEERAPMTVEVVGKTKDGYEILVTIK